MKTLITFFLTLVFFNTSAEIIIEYKVTPLNTNPFVDARRVLPYALKMTIGDKYAKLEKKRYASFANEFALYSIGEKEYYNCLEGEWIHKKFKAERINYEILSVSDASYNVLGKACKKVHATYNGRSIELYITEEFGVGFYPNAEIDGIALLIVEEDKWFGKVVYEATSINIDQVYNGFFDISFFDEEDVDGTISEHPLEGKEAKPVKLKNIDGEKVELDFADGKTYVINFWFKACKPCLEEIPILNKMVDSLASEQVRFIAISTDPIKSAKEFLDNRGFLYEQYASGQYVAGRYKVESFPTHLVIDSHGIIRYASSGFDHFTVQRLVDEVNALLKGD